MSDSSSTANEWTIARLLAWTTGHFERCGVAEGRLSAEVLLAKALLCPRIQLYTRMNECPAAGALDTFREWVKRAAAGEPIAYMVGEKEFFSLAFRVTRDVLIPRPETETLVECAVDHCTVAGWAKPVVWDLCTGSGCVAVALLKNLPAARVVASDVSQAAVEVARSNAERHDVVERFQGVCAEGLNLPGETIPAAEFDLLLCNPPYIAAKEIVQLPQGVRDFEPRMALTDESDGMSFYRTLANEAHHVLAAHGAVMVEVADGRAEAVREIFLNRPGWVYRRSVRDRTTGKERVIIVARA